jgi:hypothetical protein
MKPVSEENNFKNALLLFRRDGQYVEIGGVPFDSSADIVISSVGDDYLTVRQSLGGKERDFVIPFSAVVFVAAKL